MFWLSQMYLAISIGLGYSTSYLATTYPEYAFFCGLLGVMSVVFFVLFVLTTLYWFFTTTDRKKFN